MTSLVLLSSLILSWPDRRLRTPAGPRGAGGCRGGPRDRHRRFYRQGRAVRGRNSSFQGREHPGDPGHPWSQTSGEHARPTAAVRLRSTAAIPEPTNLISFDFGSGVVIGDHGEILTAYHVVKGARELRVRAAGRQEFEAEIIAADPRSDLAVIAPVESDGEGAPRLKPVVIGDAGKLRKGAFLIALGNSFNAARTTASRRRAGASSRMSPASSTRRSTT